MIELFGVASLLRKRKGDGGALLLNKEMAAIRGRRCAKRARENRFGAAFGSRRVGGVVRGRRCLRPVGARRGGIG